MAPAPHPGAGHAPGFEDERREVRGERVRRGGETDGACADDDDRQWLL